MGILRFLLAFSVLIGHSDHSLGVQALHTTVAVRSFYIISGFYMALVLNTKYRDKSYYVFLRSRYLRLFPAYFVILALTCLYGLMAYVVRGTVEWPFQGWSRTITDLPATTLFALTFSNIFILGQDILSNYRCDPSGNLHLDYSGLTANSAFDGYMLIPQAWTLGIELLFYMAAPFLVTRGNVVILGTMLASLACKYLLFPALGISPEMAGYRFFPFELIYFMLGSLSFKIYQALKSCRNMTPFSCLVASLLLFFLYSAPQSGLPEWARYAALATSIPFLFSLSKNSSLDRLIGELSYPMYISHILVFYMLTQFTAWGTEGPGSIITIVLSFLIYQFVDKRVDLWRESLPDTSPRRFPSIKALAFCVLAVSVFLSGPLAARHLLRARHIERSLALAHCDLIKDNPARLVAIGLEPPESNGSQHWRWGMGPKTELIFSLPHPVNISLKLEYASLPPDQTVSIVFNDIPIETIPCPTAGTVYREYTLPGRKENNVIRFVYQNWNGIPTPYVPGDSRPLAASFTRLDMDFKAAQ